VQHHSAGDLLKAEGLYRQILDVDPDQPVALNLLGVVAYQVGQSDVAKDLISKAITVKPDYVEAHSNLGLVLLELGNPDEAVVQFQKAITLSPNYAEAHNNLGNALKDLEQLDEAIIHYRKAIDINSGYAEAHYNLGVALQKSGHLNEAVTSYNDAIGINPDTADLHYNLATALSELERWEDAATSYGKAIDIQPDYSDAYNNLGGVLLELNRLGDAKAVFDQLFRLQHGGKWWNAANFTEGDSGPHEPHGETPSVSVFKLRDTIDQLEHLIAKGKIDPSFIQMIDRYRSVLTEIQQSLGSARLDKLTPEQFSRIEPFYSRVIHYVDQPRISSGAVNKSLDFETIEDSYFSSPVSITTLDNFLTPEALSSLRDFCLESTLYFDQPGPAYIGAMMARGFNCDLLYQIAEELKACFPRVIGDQELGNMWVYRHGNQSEGVAAHTDEGSVTFNFWITPDEANLDTDSGGLIVYAKDQPYDWDWGRYNALQNTPTIKQEIADFLSDAETVTIPHRQNRALLFHSNLFHKSDRVNFRDGFENRRMNVTLLFGKR